MITYQHTITRELGIHARPAILIVKNAGQFTCRISLESGRHRADAKDIMAVMSMMMCKGDLLTVTFEGTDEEQAASLLSTLISENL